MKNSLKSLSIVSLMGGILLQAPVVLAASVESDVNEPTIEEVAPVESGSVVESVESTESEVGSESVVDKGSAVESAESVDEGSDVVEEETEEAVDDQKRDYPLELDGFEDYQYAIDIGKVSLSYNTDYNGMDVRYDEETDSYTVSLRQDGISTIQRKGDAEPEVFDHETAQFGYDTYMGAESAALGEIRVSGENLSFEVYEENGRFFYNLVPGEPDDGRLDLPFLYDTIEEAEEAAKEILPDFPTHKGFVITQFENGQYQIQLTLEENVVEGNDSADEEFDLDTGFDTKEEAIEQAEALIADSDLHNGYNISKGADDKYYIQLTTDGSKTEGVEREEIKPETPKEEDNVDQDATEESFDFDKGFDTKEEAIKQAEALIKNSDINNGYNVSMGADGKYYIQLTTDGSKTEGVERKEISPNLKEEKTENPKEEIVNIDKKADTESNKSETQKLPETGEAGLMVTVVAGLASLLGGTSLLASRKRK